MDRKVGEEEEERLKRSEEASVNSVGDSKEDLKMISGRKRKSYSVFGSFDAAENRSASHDERLNSKVESREIGEEGFRTPVSEDADSISNDCDSGVETPTSLNVFSLYSALCDDSQEIIVFHPKPRQSPTVPVHMTALMPSTSELEELFTSAEIHQKKRFSEKYNYDVMMDIPLEGRYEWVPSPLEKRKKKT